MIRIEVTATVTEDGKITVQLPANITAGEHQIVLVIDERLVIKKERPPLNFPVRSCGSWPADLSLRREDMYSDWGR